MKKRDYQYLPVVLTVILCLVTACLSSQSPIPVKGEGELKEKTVNVSGFNGIEVSSGFDVLLVQGDSEGLVLMAQENLFEYITVKVEQGTLKIYTERNINQSKGLKAKITFKNIERLRVSGGGDVAAETDINVPSLDIDLSGGGDISAVVNTGTMNCSVSGGGDVKIDGKIENFNMGLSGGGDFHSALQANQIKCNMSGGGDLTLNNKERATDANISLSGGGDMELDINAEHVKCGVSGGGDAVITGKATALDIEISGGGDVNAGQLITQRTTFRANGGSDIHINASSELVGYISGGGDVYYAGNPAKIDIDAKGGSEVHKE